MVASLTATSKRQRGARRRTRRMFLEQLERRCLLAAVVVYQEDFESDDGGYTANNVGGTYGGLWHYSLGRNADGLPNHSPAHNWYYGSFETSTGQGRYDYLPGDHEGVLMSPYIDLPDCGTSTLSFNYFLATRLPTDVDFVTVSVFDGTTMTEVLSRSSGSLVQTGNSWITATADLSSFAGQAISLKFKFDTGDTVPFDPEGWYVDDVMITAEPCIDLGDAPTAGQSGLANSYPTLLIDNGARHQLVAGPRLGAVIDAESDGQPTALADGDDINGLPDDEDGVTFSTLVAGSTGTATVTASAAGLLDAWVDLNFDGDWDDAGERITPAAGLVVVAGANAVTIPAFASAGASYARFRLSTAGGLEPTGLASDGEVEDYQLIVDPALDFGDAPDPTFPTLLANNGARHAIVAGPRSGAVIDAESDGQPTAPADGDDNNGVPDDEDGVTFSTLVAGSTGTATVTASAAGLLDAWVDLNFDGDWDDAGERITPAAGLAVVAGANPVTIPAFASAGASYARFRLSTAGGLEPTGLASDGEVEDYQLIVDPALDFGDAPDPTFPTLLANNGARHAIVAGPRLGAVIDAESDGQPTAPADGDDNNGVPDDEDGVTFSTLVAGSTGTATVTASAAGLLDAWVDLNFDGDWDDAGERITPAAGLAVVAGANPVTIPAFASAGASYARFRLSTAGGLEPTGLASDGEVEDYQLIVDPALDFGDAPDPTFPTLLANNGARHAIVAGPRLGAVIDAESDGQPTAPADGDDNNGVPDDEDGVTFSTLVAGSTGTATVTASAAGLLDAWVDLNFDGDWDDAGERITPAAGLAVVAGANPVTIPAFASAGASYARFRLSTAGGLEPTGLASDGEVEDYQLIVDPALDFGDAPDPTFPTLLANNGARHAIVAGPRLAR